MVIFPKTSVRSKDNNNSPHGRFYRFLVPFSSKFSDPNFASYVSIFSHTCSEPGLPVKRPTANSLVNLNSVNNLDFGGSLVFRWGLIILLLGEALSRPLGDK